MTRTGWEGEIPNKCGMQGLLGQVVGQDVEQVEDVGDQRYVGLGRRCEREREVHVDNAKEYVRQSVGEPGTIRNADGR